MPSSSLCLWSWFSFHWYCVISERPKYRLLSNWICLKMLKEKFPICFTAVHTYSIFIGLVAQGSVAPNIPFEGYMQFSTQRDSSPKDTFDWMNFCFDLQSSSMLPCKLIWRQEDEERKFFSNTVIHFNLVSKTVPFKLKKTGLGIMFSWMINVTPNSSSNFSLVSAFINYAPFLFVLK